MPLRAKKILVVDDDSALADMCVAMFREGGYEAAAVPGAQEALKELAASPAYGIVLTDLVMPEMDGIQLLKQVKAEYPPIDVVVMTSYGTIDNAVEAMRFGAADYVAKPFKRDVLLAKMAQILEKRRLTTEVARLHRELEGRYSFDRILGQNHKMQQLYELIETISDTSASVLILGETGTGKELVARAIHYNSDRRNRPFVKVDCAALTETLLESELFGHVKGAFTGAVRDRDGRFRTANGGTVFLDEVSNIPIPIQAKLLRVLQDSEFEPVGGDMTLRVDVRALAATNVDLALRLAQGSFRSDLYYRLNVVTVELPPLRDRLDDIPLLASHFLEQYSKRNNREVVGVSQAALNKLMAYDWPGNVRELENLIERGVILCKSDTLTPQDLPLAQDAELGLAGPDSAGLKEGLAWAERRMILEALKRFQGDKDAAAKQLGISRAGLYSKIKRYGIEAHEAGKGKQD